MMNKIFKIGNSLLKKEESNKETQQDYFIENGKKYKLMLVGVEILKVEVK